MATQAVLPHPVTALDATGQLPLITQPQRSRLVRFIQCLMDDEVPNRTDIHEPLNFYNARSHAARQTGIWAYTHHTVIDIPKLHEPLPNSMNVLLPPAVARDLSLPWTPISVNGTRDAANGNPKYRYFFFIYRHRPSVAHNVALARNRQANLTGLVYSMSYFDRERPWQMVWMDFVDHRRIRRLGRLLDVYRWWSQARVAPQGGATPNWFVDPQWYNHLRYNHYVRPITTNLEWSRWDYTRGALTPREYSLYSIIATFIYYMNDIDPWPGIPHGALHWSPPIPDTFDLVTGLGPDLLPELYCCILALLRVQPNGPLSSTMVRAQADEPIPGVGGGFGLDNERWVRRHLKLNISAHDRFFRRRIRRALARLGRLGPPVMPPGFVLPLTQLPHWYLRVLGGSG